ncbi:hypothetical protein I546_3201 [Mycobacterium kansasii 732]|nr:hypothetical protein I546_3201 [Mycobacterium kansasii 732]
MVTGHQPYFAYGSNLCVRQMAARCPDATDPRPAVLSDHDWLINQRGVATVAPFTGSQVHGVLWQVSDHDLATLDSAEGVPVRYRRYRCSVHTDTGPTPAWVYIDHRVTAGPPRPGYLPRVIDGAVHHGLPQRWIDFLHRWDPARWPSPNPQATSEPAPQSLSALLREPGVREISRLRSRFGFLAIHGGDLEKMTDVIAERAAEAADASVYLVRHPDRYPHHLPSARFDPAESARLAEFLDHVDVAVSLHGYGRIGRGTQLLAGAATARWPPTLPDTSSCPATRSSLIWRPFRWSCVACTPAIRSTGYVAAEPNWSCRRACGGSAHAVPCRDPTACPRSPPHWW